jgi:hypothetical protein
MTPPSVSAVRDVEGKPFPGGISARLALPVIAAPMFLVSGPALVIACCRAGIVGTLPALNQRTSEGFEDWLREIRNALSEERGRSIFGVNLIVHSTNPRLQQDLKICREYEVPLVITSLGIAPELVKEVHGYGGLVLHDVVSRRHAEKAAAAGVDGLILVCGGAGRTRRHRKSVRVHCGDSRFLRGNDCPGRRYQHRGARCRRRSGGRRSCLYGDTLYCDTGKSRRSRVQAAHSEQRHSRRHLHAGSVRRTRQLSAWFAGAVRALARWPGAIARCEVPWNR